MILRIADKNSHIDYATRTASQTHKRNKHYRHGTGAHIDSAVQSMSWCRPAGEGIAATHSGFTKGQDNESAEEEQNCALYLTHRVKKAHTPNKAIP